jgi:tRNA-(ms[2]io[6]A)-hydroxylase
MCPAVDRGRQHPGDPAERRTGGEMATGETSETNGAKVDLEGPDDPLLRRLELPLLHATPRAWAELAAASLPVFLADHAVCEQQAALAALGLVGHYPADAELVERMTALAAEEIAHLRRVSAILRRRGLHPAKRRPNPWVRELLAHQQTDREPELKVDRLLVCALIEARSCERFSRLLEVVEDEEIESLLRELGPAEHRHWRILFDLASRELPPERLEPRWRRWLEIEARLTARGGRRPVVHG